MQNRTITRPRARAAVKTAPAQLNWQYLLVTLVCGAVIAAGFFFAARQHFISMDYGFKNSKLRKQLEGLEAENRRLVLAREVSMSPAELRKAAKNVIRRESTARPEFASLTTTEPAGRSTTGMDDTAGSTAKIERTVFSAPVKAEKQPAATVPARKENTAIATLIKLK